MTDISDVLDLGTEKTEALRQAILAAHRGTNTYLIIFRTEDGEEGFVNFTGAPRERMQYMQDELGLDLLNPSTRWAYAYRSERTGLWERGASDSEMEELILVHTS